MCDRVIDSGVRRLWRSRSRSSFFRCDFPQITRSPDCSPDHPITRSPEWKYRHGIEFATEPGGTVKKVLLAFAALAFSVVGTAEVTKYKDWPKSPEAYFLTPAERAEWAKLSSDPEAETFIAVYYARRGGDRFKEEIARRIAAADSQFKLRRQRGAESARGRLLITLGGPSRVSTSRAQEHGGVTGDAGLDTRPEGGAGFASASPGAATQTWIYAKDKFDPSWGIGDLAARINVDPARGTDELQNPEAINRAVAVVAEKSIVNPSATASASAAAPSGAAVPPAAG